MEIFYDREGQPISAERFTVLHRDRRYKTIAVSSLRGLFVSTVWLGVNHEWQPGKPPLIFETMIFREDERGVPDMGEDLWCTRYATEERARAGHELAVIAVRLGEVS